LTRAAGAAIAQFLTGEIVNPHLAPDIAIGIMSHVLNQTKRYGVGVGGPTDICLIRKDGSVSYVDLGRIKTAEVLGRVVLEKANAVMVQALGAPDDQLEMFIRDFSESIRDIRRITLLDDAGRLKMRDSGTAIVRLGGIE